ncbi:hypothetical protein F4859DRAFT_518013 [Xylaria cf. heliscus]|nr:hypothetical protein F4859DRAFT_518013 [Xylaria cf. heliscus]
MSSTTDLRITFAATLEHISAQLDGTTGIVKIPTSLFKLLDIQGQTEAKRHASSILGYPVEFYLDSTNLSRVSLANIASINALRPCKAQAIPGLSLPVLILPVGQQSLPPIDGEQPNVTPPPEAPQPPLPAPRNKGKKATRSPDDFTTFRQHRWPFVKQQNPGIQRNEIRAILNAEWEAMTEEGKRPYSQLTGYHLHRRPSDNLGQSSVQTEPDSLDQGQNMDDQRPPGYLNGLLPDLSAQPPTRGTAEDFGQGLDANGHLQGHQTDDYSPEALAFSREEMSWTTRAHMLFPIN